MILTRKQTTAIDILDDGVTEELLYGGSAGPGKSSLGCYWQIKRRLKYPESRGMIARAVLKTLKDTTLKTFFEIAKMQGLKRGTHYELTSAQDKEFPNCIVFYNKSFIYLRDLYAYPSDPDFDDLGSLEITDAFIDEISQVTVKAKDTLKTRIRFGLDKFGLIPKVLYATNPSKNWGYDEFYKPHREGKLPAYKRFLPALVTDNPFVSKAYIQSLQNLPPGPQKERLLYGNWEYSDDPLLMMEYDRILELFTNEFILPTPDKYITADIAYEGSDMFVIGVWHGLVLTEIEAMDKCDETQVSKVIHDIRIKHSVPLSNVCYDADGLKTFVKQSAKSGYLNGAKPYHNNGKALNDENYFNLKSQCYFYAANYVNDSKIYISEKRYRKQIIEECEQVKKLVTADDGKLRVEKKADMKLRLKRSPDFWDMISMRMFFEIKPKNTMPPSWTI